MTQSYSVQMDPPFSINNIYRSLITKVENNSKHSRKQEKSVQVINCNEESTKCSTRQYDSFINVSDSEHDFFSQRISNNQNFTRPNENDIETMFDVRRESLSVCMSENETKFDEEYTNKTSSTLSDIEKSFTNADMLETVFEKVVEEEYIRKVNHRNKKIYHSCSQLNWDVSYRGCATLGNGCRQYCERKITKQLMQHIGITDTKKYISRDLVLQYQDENLWLRLFYKILNYVGMLDTAIVSLLQFDNNVNQLNAIKPMAKKITYSSASQTTEENFINHNEEDSSSMYLVASCITSKEEIKLKGIQVESEIPPIPQVIVFETIEDKVPYETKYISLSDFIPCNTGETDVESNPYYSINGTNCRKPLESIISTNQDPRSIKTLNIQSTTPQKCTGFVSTNKKLFSCMNTSKRNYIVDEVKKFHEIFGFKDIIFDETNIVLLNDNTTLFSDRGVIKHSTNNLFENYGSEASLTGQSKKVMINDLLPSLDLLNRKKNVFDECQCTIM